VQCIYFDPPYGIKFNSNWQVSTQSRDVKDGRREDVSREPEQVKAFRDTWKDGIHSYLTYLRDRLTVARELLAESGSIFVQIGDENVHRVRAVMDEVFGENTFISLIPFRTTSSFSSNSLSRNHDFILWYSRGRESIKYRALLTRKAVSDDDAGRYTRVEESSGHRRFMSQSERLDPDSTAAVLAVYRHDNLLSQGRASGPQPYVFQGYHFDPWQKNSHWKPNFPIGLERLARANRLALPTANSIAYIRYHKDFPLVEQSSMWTDTQTGAFTDLKTYVVQTNTKVIERCILMARTNERPIFVA